MALVQTWSEAGDGKLISSTKSSRKYRTDVGDGYYEDYYEEEETELRRWYALSENAAQYAVTTNAQPTDKEATYSWAMSVDNQIIGSYLVERTMNRVKTTLVGTNGDVPTPTFSVDGQMASVDARHTQPHTVAIACASSSAKIEYRIGQFINQNDSGYYLFGDWINSGANNANPSINSNHVPALPYFFGSYRFRKVRLEAKAYVEVNGVKKYSATKIDEYLDTIEVADVIHNSNFNFNTTNKTVSMSGITHPDPSAIIFARIYRYNKGTASATWVNKGTTKPQTDTTSYPSGSGPVNWEWCAKVGNEYSDAHGVVFTP